MSKFLKSSSLSICTLFILFATTTCAKTTTKSCKCEVTRETTKTGKGWTVESVKTIYEPHENCDDGDRTEVLVMPSSGTLVGGQSYYTTNGIREITDCGK